MNTINAFPFLYILTGLFITKELKVSFINNNEIKISAIQNDPCNAGKILNLDIITLTALLYKIELMGYIKVVRTAGLDVIRITKPMTFLECVEEDYMSINK